MISKCDTAMLNTYAIKLWKKTEENDKLMVFFLKISTYLNTFQFNRIFNTNSNYCWKVFTYIFHNISYFYNKTCLWEARCIWYDITFGSIVFVLVHRFNFLNWHFKCMFTRECKLICKLKATYVYFRWQPAIIND